MSPLMRRCVLILSVVLALAACAAPPSVTPQPTAAPTSAPASPEPTPVVLSETYENPAGGFGVRFPANWQTRSLSDSALALAANPAAIDAPSPGDDLVVLIDTTPLELIAERYGANATTDVQSFFEISSDGPLQAGYTIGSATPVTLNGTTGLAADLTAAGGAGRLLVMLTPDRAVRVLGQAAPAAWEEQQALFDAIVATLEFFAPPPTATPVPEDMAEQPEITTAEQEGFVLRLGGNTGPRGGRFVAARGMTVAPDGTLFLAESGRGIWVFAPDGTLQRTFGHDVLLDAYDIARAPDGDLYVADYGANAIVHFSADGEFVKRWGETGDAPEQFGLSAPQRIAVGADGSVYALDNRVDPATNAATSSVVRFDGADGAFRERIELPVSSAPNDLAVDAQGAIYLAETFTGMVLKLDAEGTVLARLGETVAPEGLAVGAIDLDTAGNIYVATWRDGILKLAPNGTLLASGGSVATEGTIPAPGEFSLPNGVAAGPGNVVWVSDNSGEYSAVTALRLVSDAAMSATATAISAEVATPVVTPVATVIRQWASSASASSFYTGYEPESVTGPPDVEGCRDSTDAWASAEPNSVATLEARFRTPVFATGVTIHQNLEPGFVSQVEVLDERDEWTTVYEGRPRLRDTCPYVQEITFDQTLHRVVAVRLTLDQRRSRGGGWNEIDAVELIGVR